MFSAATDAAMTGMHGQQVTVADCSLIPEELSCCIISSFVLGYKWTVGVKAAQPVQADGGNISMCCCHLVLVWCYPGKDPS